MREPEPRGWSLQTDTDPATLRAFVDTERASLQRWDAATACAMVGAADPGITNVGFDASLAAARLELVAGHPAEAAERVVRSWELAEDLARGGYSGATWAAAPTQASARLLADAASGLSAPRARELADRVDHMVSAPWSTPERLAGEEQRAWEGRHAWPSLFGVSLPWMRYYAGLKLTHRRLLRAVGDDTSVEAARAGADGEDHLSGSIRHFVEDQQRAHLVADALRLHAATVERGACPATAAEAGLLLRPVNGAPVTFDSERCVIEATQPGWDPAVWGPGAG